MVCVCVCVFVCVCAFDLSRITLIHTSIKENIVTRWCGDLVDLLGPLAPRNRFEWQLKSYWVVHFQVHQLVGF